MENDSASAEKAAMKLNFSKPAVFSDYGGATAILCSIFHVVSMRVRLPLPSIQIISWCSFLLSCMVGDYFRAENQKDTWRIW